MNAVIDHLWQSMLCVALVIALASLTQANSARVRLWLWRLALVKLLVPFAALVAIGEWYGFPIRYAGEPPPASAVMLVAQVSPWFAPSAWLGSTGVRILVGVILLIATAAGARRLLGEIHDDARRARVEELRLEADPDDSEPSIGFLRAALFTACALGVLAIPLFGGAVRDGVHAHGVLEANTRSMTEARVTVRPAAPGLGSRYFVSVTAQGVAIRNITLQELTAMAYGVTRFFVRGKHFKEAGERDWLVDSRHDVFVEAPILEPEKFDTYAMRPAITRQLAKNFGLEIYVNSECQDPCGKWGDRVLVEVAPGTWRLVDKGLAPAAPVEAP
jgi:hypothetical protein